MIKLLIYILLITFISFVPYLCDKNKFRLNLVTKGILNKLLIFIFLLFVILEEYVCGILLLILYFVIDIEKDKTIEGYINYIK